MKRTHKEQIVMCYLLVTRGRLPAHLGKLLQAMREIVGDVGEAEVRTSSKWTLRQTLPREPRKMRRAPAADVADVALVPGIRRDDRACAQCNADGEPLVRVDGLDVWLHPECRPFWFKNHPEADGIPATLRRAPALGPVGDSLDDL